MPNHLVVPLMSIIGLLSYYAFAISFYKIMLLFSFAMIKKCCMFFLFSPPSGHKNWVLCIAWSPDGKYLVSGSKAGELICWDPQTGKALGNPLMVSYVDRVHSLLTCLFFWLTTGNYVSYFILSDSFVQESAYKT